MKRPLGFLLLLVLLLLPVQVLAVPDHIEYFVNVNADGSANWKIIQVTDINSTVDSLDEFLQKLLSTISVAKDNTGRNMSLDMNSIEIKTVVHWETSSQTIEYFFRWENFSASEDGKIVFGDVFSYDFPKFYGDGELYVACPQEYTVSSTSPLPDEQNSLTQTLHWYRTQDFLAIKPKIVFTKSVSVADLSQTTLAFMGSGVFAAVAISFLLLRQRQQRKMPRARGVESCPPREVKDNKERILQLVKSSGGSLRQSEICTQLRFSRTKTSILLAEMEKNNQVKRDKKGKNKIVYVLR